MTPEKQKLLVEYLISSHDVYAVCSSIIQSKYFDPELRNAVKFIASYYDKYHTTPNPDQIEAESGVELSIRQVCRDEIAYCAEEIEKFCKEEAIKHAILESPALLEKGDIGAIEQKIKDAVMVSLTKSLGTNLFDDADALLSELINTEYLATEWPEFDMSLGGGLQRQEILLLSANSGGGKSIVMNNLGIQYARKGLNVLYLSFELPVKMIFKRSASIVTQIEQLGLNTRLSEVKEILNSSKRQYGNFIIEHMPPQSNSNQIRAFLKEFELKYGYVPDVIIIDYLDLIAPNEKVSHENIFQKDKLATEQIRQIGMDYNALIITASQQNRGAINASEFDQSIIAGGMSKVNTVDVYATIIMTEQMRAMGQMIIQFLKTRSSDGVGKAVQLVWNGKTLTITDPTYKPNQLVIKKKTAYNEKSDEQPKSSSLLDLF